MKVQDFWTWLLPLAGSMCLAIGAISAGPAWAGDYDEEFRLCVSDCEKKNGKGHGSPVNADIAGISTASGTRR